MIAWLSQIFKSVASTKTAFIALMFVLILVFLWRWGNRTIEAYGVPSIYVKYLFIIAGYALSHLLVESGYRVTKFINKEIEKILKFRTERNLLKTKRKKVQDSIPLLPTEQRDILLGLAKSNSILKISSNSAPKFLNESGYIQVIQRVSAGSYLVELNPDVKDIVMDYAEQERRDSIALFVRDINEKEIEFLKIFFYDTIPFGTAESGAYMKYNIFSAGEGLERKGFIDCDKKSSKSIVKFKLHIDLAEKLSETVFDNEYKRSEVNIDLHFVLDEPIPLLFTIETKTVTMEHRYFFKGGFRWQAGLRD